MVGPRGPIGPWLSHKLCNTVNMTPILSMKRQSIAHITSYTWTFKSIFLMVIQLVILGVSYSFFRWIFIEILKNKFLNEVIKRET